MEAVAERSRSQMVEKNEVGAKHFLLLQMVRKNEEDFVFNQQCLLSY